MSYKVYGYIRASTAVQVQSPDTQKQIITRYAASIGVTVDGFYIDRAVSGKHHMMDREAGRELMLALRPGDHVIFARLDRLSRSFYGFAKVLDQWEKMGITMHMCDMPFPCLGKETDPLKRMFIQMLVTFAEYERQMIRVRTAEGLAALKENGGKWTNQSKLGYKWHKLPDGKWTQIVDPMEMRKCMKVLEMRRQGYIYQAICDYLNRTWKVKTRCRGKYRDPKSKGGEYTPQYIRKMMDVAIEYLKRHGETVPDEGTAEYILSPECEQIKGDTKLV